MGSPDVSSYARPGSYTRRDASPRATPLQVPNRNPGGLPPSLAHLARMQSSAGNRAVAGLLVQRNGPSPAPVSAGPAANAATLAQLDAMTLLEFDDHARNQADWSTISSLPSVARRQLMTLLEWARGRPATMTGCGGMTVAALRATGVTRTTRRALETYSEAVEGTGTAVELPAIDDVAKATGWGEALQSLYATPGREQAKEVIKQDGDAAHAETGQLEMLRAHSLVADYVQYIRRVRPYLESHADTKAYLWFRTVDNANPITYHGRIRDVHNYHRFENALLDALARNLSDRTRTKPLSLVLHSSHDHNGAFMHDANLTAAFQRATHLTLMIEGSTSLSAMSGRMQGIARRYGQNRKIKEAMIAGHGGSRSLELTGVPGAEPDNLNLDRNATATERFFNALLDNMEDSPDARVVLNACLTASNSVRAPLDPSDPAAARAAVNQAIADNPSLATRLRTIATDRGVSTEVRGASGSFSSEARLLDANNRLDIVSGADPQLTNPDKLQYVRHGIDPDGVMRALLEVWAQDSSVGRQTTRTEVVARRNELVGNTGLKQSIIREMYAVILGNWDNAQLINQFADCATPLAHLAWPNECRPAEWSGADTLAQTVPPSHMARLFTAVVASPAAAAPAAYVTALARAQVHSSARSAFLTTAAGYGCRDIDRYTPRGLLTGHLSIASILASGGSAASKLRFAVFAVRESLDGHEAAKTHLQTTLGSATRFPASAGVAAAIDGYWNEPALLDAIDRGPQAAAPTGSPGSGSGSSAPTPNLDADQDGTNDTYVEPMTRRGAVTVRSLRVRGGPDASHDPIGGLARGARVDVIGRSGSWFAIDHARRIGFVASRYVRLRSSL